MNRTALPTRALVPSSTTASLRALLLALLLALFLPLSPVATAQGVVPPAATPTPTVAPAPVATSPASQQEPVPPMAAQVPVPPLTAQVTDNIGMLSPAQRATLEATLGDYARRTGTQVGILLIASTAPEAIEQYGIRVADAWKLGRKGIDDGVILIVARDNPKDLRRLRLEVGRGVQGTVTDAKSNRILQEVIAPHFRQNDYYGGLVAATSALTTLLDQEHLPAPAKKPAASAAGDFAGALPLIIIMLIGIALIGSRMRRGGGGTGLDSNGWGRTAAGVIIGSQIGSALGGGGFRGFGGGGGGGFSGGGGGFDGGGASGNW